jgi:hypothetical protein
MFVCWHHVPAIFTKSLFAASKRSGGMRRLFLTMERCFFHHLGLVLGKYGESMGRWRKAIFLIEDQKILEEMGSIVFICGAHFWLGRRFGPAKKFEGPTLPSTS